MQSVILLTEITAACLMVVIVYLKFTVAVNIRVLMLVVLRSPELLLMFYVMAAYVKAKYAGIPFP